MVFAGRVAEWMGRVRVGIRYRVGALGGLGILGLALIGALYLYSERQQAAMQAQCTTAAGMSGDFAQALRHITEARQAEVDFWLLRTEREIGQQIVASEAAQDDLRTVVSRPHSSPVAQAAASLALDQVSVYQNRVDDLADVQRRVGLSHDDGLRAGLRADSAAIKAALAAVNDGWLLADLLRLQMAASRVAVQHESGDAQVFEEGAAALLAKISGLSGPGSEMRQDLIGAVSRYRDDFLRFVEQDRLVVQGQSAVADAYEEARAAVEAALRSARTQASGLERSIAAAQKTTVRRMAWSITAATIVVAVLSLLIGRDISKPLEQVAAATNGLAAGDQAVAISGVDRRDEVGDVARALAVFRTLAAENRGLMLEREERHGREQAARTQSVHVIAGQIEAAIGSIVGSVASAAARLREGTAAVVATVGQTRTRANEVAASSLTCASGVQGVAATTEELAITLDQVSREVTRSAEAARRAASAARTTGEIVDGLSSGAMRVGNVTALIASVAARTNLLALNATIEAARAGSAGRGFSVVATEIKALAKQTATAAQEIKAQISAMQDATRHAVAAMQAIGAEFTGMDLAAAAVAATVEQQQEATQEMAWSAQNVAIGVERVSEAVNGLRSDAETADEVAKIVREASDGMAVVAGELTGGLVTLLSDLKARA